MIVIDPVVEILDAAGFTAWPIENLPAGNLLPLSAQLSAADVGTVMTVIANCNRAIPEFAVA